jgi:Uma2 family endonuclease
MTRDMSTTTSSLLTAADLERLALPDKQVELVRGHLFVREPPGTWHGTIAARLTRRVGDFVERLELGVVCAQDTGFRIASDPDTVRAPDLAFIARDRAAQIPRRGYAELAPDLVAEILSPDDRPGEVLAKVADWLDAGTRLVWVLDPERGDARVYRHDGTLAVLGSDATLDGENVLPGFSCTLREILV